MQGKVLMIDLEWTINIIMFYMVLLIDKSTFSSKSILAPRI